MNDTDFKIWFWIEAAGACVAVPAKCGGTSFYRSMFAVPDNVPSEHVRSFAVNVALKLGAGPFDPWEVVHYFSDERKILAVRDPVTRFASLWRDKYQHATPRQLLEVIEAWPRGDPHWIQQHTYLVPRVELVKYYRLGGILGYDRWENETQNLVHDDPPMPIEALLRYYALDKELWETAR